MREITLYRLWNEAGELLWVGQTINPHRRLNDHRRQSNPWSGDIHRMTRDATFNSRRDALDAERAAIRSEAPRHNTHHNHAEMMTTSDVLESIPGMTYRQLDYWCRNGYVTPTTKAVGSGSRRLFNSADIDDVRDMATTYAQISSWWNSGELIDRIRAGDVYVDALPPLFEKGAA